MDQRTAMWRVVTLMVGSVLPFLLLSWVLIAPADAHETMPVYTHWIVTPSVQGTPTVDPTMTALEKEKLAQEVDQLKNQNRWAWTTIGSIGGTIGGIGTILLAIVGLITARNSFKQWLGNRKDEEKKQEAERVESIVSIVQGLAGERTEARVAAAILLSALFLRPGYEQFYKVIFDLSAANLRLRKADPDISVPPDPLSQALITAFKESFPRTRDWEKTQSAQFDPRSLDASGVRLDSAYLAHVDLEGASLVGASLRGTILFDANLQGSDLRGVNLEEANLREANLRGANLRGANPEAARSLEDTKMYGVIGLTKEQRDAFVKKGANITDPPPVPDRSSSRSPSDRG